MCRRLGRKKLQELGMLNNSANPDVKIRRVVRAVGGKYVTCYPRPDFTLTLHEKMIRVPSRPLFFNYMTRVLWEHTLLRDRIWCTTNPGGYANAVRPAVAKHYAKLERYYNCSASGSLSGDRSLGYMSRRREKLADQGIRLWISLSQKPRSVKR